MASGFAQHYLECTTCDSNAEYHCNTCQFDLCQTCKETHQRKKKTENHEVVLYKDRNEKVEEMCCIHNDKTYDACCKECELPVCIKCIKESHSRHAIVEIEDIFNEKLKMFNKHVQELKEKIIPQCEDVQRDLNREMERCMQSLIQIRSDLLATAQAIKDMVDLVLQEKIEKLRKIEDSLKQELQYHETELETYTKSLNSIIEEFEVLRKTEKKAEFIMKHKEKLQINRLQTLSNMYYTPAPSFTPCHVSKEQIERLIGDIVEKPQKHLPSKTELHRLVEKARCCRNFEIASTSKEVGHIDMSDVMVVRHIAFQDENTFWANDGSGCIRQVDMQGQTLHTIKTASSGDGIHAVTEQGVLYIAANKKIYLSDGKGREKDLITFEDWEPVSVYKSRLNGEIFVGMKRGSTARVTRYNEDGKVLHHIQFTEQEIGKSPRPHFITENKNGDVIVTSNGGDKVVIVLDSKGKYRFKYTGNPEKSMGNPWGVVTDILNNILICDYNNEKIHIINKDGVFRTCIDVYTYGYPSAVEIDLTQNVWVGFLNSARIGKFQYLQEHE